MYQRKTAPQSIGGVLDSGFKLYTASFKDAYLLAFAAAFLSAPLSRMGGGLEEPPVMDVGAGFLLTLVVFIAVAVTLSAAMFARIDAVANNLELPIGAALSYGLQRAPAMFAASLLCGLAIMVGMFLLVIPGLIFMVWLIFAPQITVIEKLGPLESLRRSRQLVRGHWWRTAGLLTVIGIIVSVIYMAIGIVISLGGALDADEILATGRMPWWVDFVLTPVLSAIATPLAYSLIIATFYDLRNRHEGGDIAERIATATA